MDPAVASLDQDPDLWVVNKPSGVSTHRSSAVAQEGIYEYLQRRSAGPLALLHRLDKGTSGVLVFGRTPAANKALTEQLAARQVEKRYLLVAQDDPARPERLVCDKRLRRKPGRGKAELDAETRFTLLERGGGFALYEARPQGGRPHQVRVHAAQLGLPLVGDGEYGGLDGPRLFLHAAEVRFRHPQGHPYRVEAPLPESFRALLAGAPRPEVAARAAAEARAGWVATPDTDAYLWIDRHHDGFPHARVERLGAVAHVVHYADAPLTREQRDALLALGASAVVERQRPRKGEQPPPALTAGALGDLRFRVRELGLDYWVDLEASGTSSGLFLDQRETRRRLLEVDRSGQTALNTFAHTGALSVAAARAGAETLSLDLSKRYLAWARENLELNGIDPGAHDFMYGDTRDWLRRFAKKGRRFDLVLLDPPSYSTHKGSSWSVARDLSALIAEGLKVLAPGGELYVSTNLRRMKPEAFLEHVRQASSGRPLRCEFVTLPLDHRAGPQDPPYLKGAWLSAP
ncbi:MAG: pseudouridine synthase [Planctomycetota bacterium]